jgi:hypothetical protein
LKNIVIGIPRDPAILPGIDRLKDLEHLSIVHKLKLDADGIAAIWRFQFRSNVSIPKWKGKIEGIKSIELLSRDVDGSFLVYAKADFRLGLGRFFENLVEGNLFQAFELSPDFVKISFLGTKKGIASFVAQLDRTKVHYKILSGGNAKFTRENVLSGLTAIQRNVLIAAHSTGYFEVPRKITTESLADRLGIDKSTLSEHLRKAEKKVVDDLFS